MGRRGHGGDSGAYLPLNINAVVDFLVYLPLQVNEPVGYVSHTEGSLIQNHSTNLALFAMTTIVPAIGYLLMLIPIHFYNITGEGHRKMMSEIAERRASIAAETAAEMQSAGETK